MKHTIWYGGGWMNYYYGPELSWATCKYERCYYKPLNEEKIYRRYFKFLLRELEKIGAVVPTYQPGAYDIVIK